MLRQQLSLLELHLLELLPLVMHQLLLLQLSPLLHQSWVLCPSLNLPNMLISWCSTAPIAITLVTQFLPVSSLGAV